MIATGNTVPPAYQAERSVVSGESRTNCVTKNMTTTGRSPNLSRSASKTEAHRAPKRAVIAGVTARRDGTKPDTQGNENGCHEPLPPQHHPEQENHQDRTQPRPKPSDQTGQRRTRHLPRAHQRIQH